MAKRGCQTPCFSVSELRNDTEKQDVCAALFISRCGCDSNNLRDSLTLFLSEKKSWNKFQRLQHLLAAIRDGWRFKLRKRCKYFHFFRLQEKGVRNTQTMWNAGWMRRFSDFDRQVIVFLQKNVQKT
jgi:hypothetical protein